MSFLNVKATKPELDRLKKRKIFSKRGEDLLEIKQDQINSSLKSILDKYFILRNKMRDQIMDNFKLLEHTYDTIGQRKVARISRLHEKILNPAIQLNLLREMGIDVPKISLKLSESKLPCYSLSDTNLSLDILIKNLNDTLKMLIQLAEMDSILYKLAEDKKKIQRRIDALGDIIIPQLNQNIKIIEEILDDEEREEFIRLKKIKEFLERDEK